MTVFDIKIKPKTDECYTKCGYIKYYFDDESKENKSRLVKKWNLIISEQILNKGEEQYW